MGFWSQVGRENRSKIDPKSIPKGIRKMIEKKGPLGSVLEASWDPKIHGNRCTRPRWRVRRGPSLGFFRISFGFFYVSPQYILRSTRSGRIRGGKECEKEVRVWDSVRQAQSFGLARRIQRAAELRTRHRA